MSVKFNQGSMMINALSYLFNTTVLSESDILYINLLFIFPFTHQCQSGICF